MSWAAVAVGVGGAVVGGVASNSAAKKQAGAADQAGQISQDQYEQTRTDLMPYQDAGQVTLKELMLRMGILNERSGMNYNEQQASPNFGQLTDEFGLDDFEKSPAYQFNLDQGMEAINKSAAAKQKYYAPATLQDIGKYAQGLASNEFQNAFNNNNTNENNLFSRLSGIANSGQNAAAQVGTFGSQAAGQAGEAAMGAGNAQAAGIMGGANAIAGSAGDAYNSYLMSQVLGQRQSPTYGVNNSNRM